jgi:hypothetical protein
MDPRMILEYTPNDLRGVLESLEAFPQLVGDIDGETLGTLP